MFVRIMTAQDRQALVARFLANRKLLKTQNQQEELQQKDATIEFEKSFKPLLEPVRGTQKGVAEVAQRSRETTTALETLPRDIAAALPPAPQPVGPPPSFDEAASRDLQTAPQKFNDAGRARIVRLGPVAAAVEMPPNWRELLLAPTGARPADVDKEWAKWVWREDTGARQARGALWEKFEQDVLAAMARKPRVVHGEGVGTVRAKMAPASQHSVRRRRQSPRRTRACVRYYKGPEELMDRLQVLAASVSAGNNSLELINEASDILDRLRADGEIDDPTFEHLLRAFA